MPVALSPRTTIGRSANSDHEVLNFDKLTYRQADLCSHTDHCGVGGSGRALATAVIRIAIGLEADEAASTGTYTIQDRLGVQIGCFEEIAFHKSFISRDQADALAATMLNSPYGRNILKAIE